MLISIGKNTEKYMKILGISSYPFTIKELKAAYKQALLINHPDKGGSENKMKQINNAMENIKHLAQQDISETDNEHENTLQRKNIDEDIFTVYETCSSCKGTGFYDYPLERSSYCSNCSGSGFHEKTIQCKHCKGTGNFTLKSGRIITCRTCVGTGIFNIIRRKCTTCAGSGRSVKIEIQKEYCPYCKGTGKTKLTVYNPVIRKGAILI